MLASTGRGGAGNIRSGQSPKITPQDLETPTLKTSVVTTGRGGHGNMVAGDSSVKRTLQDVEAIPRRDSGGATHYGRGGANVFKGSPEEEAAARKAKAEGASAVDDEQSSFRKSPSPEDKGNGLAAKGKQWFNNLGKKA
ncbi:uncharacterized protein ColSpa_08466 [Colletotrichum spaethianum]|uniref:Uncharacterized protein n=1 Tax=Colletotrichum spaethianum TaxID=700344 RepID=A0AA37UNC9_9PEZI|nr:uncharacterized protein ColSpa_08466 [Colletotrichum spaethianum]GKT48285.1 hypothetical protein ColSpa_08466 [Colletotrichum spaethianum]